MVNSSDRYSWPGPLMTEEHKEEDLLSSLGDGKPVQ